jgi:hypothetical protein
MREHHDRRRMALPRTLEQPFSATCSLFGYQGPSEKIRWR